MTRRYKKGDTVICIKPIANCIVGRKYTIVSILGQLCVNGGAQLFIEHPLVISCFELYKPKPIVFSKEEDYYKWLSDRLK